MARFGLTLDQQRFLTIASGIGVAICVSSTYCFSIFSNTLKMEFNFGQDDITTMSTLGTAFGMFSLPAGMLFDFVGPQYVLAAATLMMGGGFLLFGLALQGYISGSIAMFCVANALLSWGGGWMDVGSLMTSILHFPCHRGPVVAVQKTFMGLGATVLATMYVAFFQTELAAFAYFMAGLVGVLGIAGCVIIRLPAYYVTVRQAAALDWEGKAASAKSLEKLKRLPPSQRRFRVAYGLLGVNLVFLTVLNFVEAFVSVGHRGTIACAVVSAVLVNGFWCLPWVPSEHEEEGGENDDIDGSSSRESSPKPSTDDAEQEARKKLIRRGGTRADDDAGTLTSADACFHTIGATGAGQRAPTISYSSAGDGSDTHQCSSLPAADYPVIVELPQIETEFLANLKTPILWALFWTCACNLGTGVVVVLNSAQIYRALNDNEFVVSTNALYVALMGVGSALARVGVGLTEMTLTERRNKAFAGEGVGGTLRVASPTLLYPLPSACFVLGLTMLFWVPVKAIAVPLVVCAAAYGMIWAVTAVCIRQIFAHNVGKHYNFCFLGAVGSSVLLNRVLFGETYDSLATEQGTYPFCGGIICIRTCVLTLIGLNATAALTGFYIHFAYRRHCSKVLFVTPPRERAM